MNKVELKEKKLVIIQGFSAAIGQLGVQIEDYIKNMDKKLLKNYTCDCGDNHVKVDDVIGDNDLSAKDIFELGALAGMQVAYAELDEWIENLAGKKLIAEARKSAEEQIETLIETLKGEEITVGSIKDRATELQKKFRGAKDMPEGLRDAVLESLEKIKKEL